MKVERLPALRMHPRILESSKAKQGRGGSKVLFHGKLEALVAGMSVSLDAPILWLHAMLYHPDLFLSVVVHLQHA